MGVSRCLCPFARSEGAGRVPRCFGAQAFEQGPRASRTEFLRGLAEHWNAGKRWGDGLTLSLRVVLDQWGRHDRSQA